MKRLKGLIIIGSGILAAQQGFTMDQPLSSSDRICEAHEQEEQTEAEKKAAEEEAHDLALRESLLVAIEARDEEKVKSLLSQIIEAHRVIENQKTGSLLHFAVQSDSVAIVEAVATAGANIAAFDQSGFNSLHLALTLQNPNSEAIALKLLDFKAQYNTTVRSSGKSPLHFAAATDKVKALTRIIEARVESIDHEDKVGETALVLAAQAGAFGAVDVLVSHGANINKKSKVNEQSVFEKHISNEMAQHLRYREGLRQHSHAKLAEAVKKKNHDMVQEAFSEGARLNGNYYEQGQWIHKQYDNGESILHIAAAYGNYDFVKTNFKLFSDADIKAKNKNAVTPLKKALDANHQELAELLMTRISGVVSEEESSSALVKFHEAVKTGIDDEIRYYLSSLSIAEVNQKDSSGMTALDHALAVNDMPIAEELFKKIPQLSLVVQNPSQENLLHVAVRLGRTDAAQFLLVKEQQKIASKKTATKNKRRGKVQHKKVNLTILRAKNKAGQTPLQLALDLNKQEMASFLIDYVEEIKVPNEDVLGSTRVHMALEKGVEDAMNYFVRYGDREEVNRTNTRDHTPLRLAVDLVQDEHSIEELKAFALKYAAELLNCIDGFDRSAPMQWAAQNHRSDVVRYYLLRNPNNKRLFNQANRAGLTPLWFAIKEDDKEIIKLLMTQVPKDMQDTEENKYQVWYAAKEGRDDVVRYYLKEVIDLQAAFNSNSYTWDKKTVKEKEQELIEAYIKHWQVNEDGYNPLHVAAFQGHDKVLTVLINKCPKVDALKDLFNERTSRRSDKSIESYDTALHLAARHDHAACVKLLIDAEVKTDIKNAKGKSPWAEYKEKTKDTAKGKNKGKKRLNLTAVEEEIRELLKRARPYGNSKSK